MSDARRAILKLLVARSSDATICPSEAARMLATDGEWRGAMPEVHDAVDQLVGDGQVDLSWKGQALTARTGPYRIGFKRPI
jgi:hypothetical protein